jgi:phospholipase C
VPPTNQHVPAQESGVRRARPVPYDLDMTVKARPGQVTLDFVNHGKAGAVFHLRNRGSAMTVQMFTVGAGHDLSTKITALQGYDLEVHGPNGWFRHLAGAAAGPEVSMHRRGHRVEFVIDNNGPDTDVTVADAYTGRSRVVHVRHGATLPIGDSHDGWYDLTFTTSTDKQFVRQIAGHVENGCVSITDPALGR